MCQFGTINWSRFHHLHSQTANKRNNLTFIAEPLDDGLAEKLESGKVNLNWDNRKVKRNAVLVVIHHL